MKRPALVLAAVMFAATGALTACGTTHATDAGSGSAPKAQTSESAQPQRWQRNPASMDQKLPDVSKPCTDAPAGQAGTTPINGGNCG
ncbi:hypothetical protein [Kitasatospora sp. CB01950]|uniref:hypothetical protein n=1 Tax=Kitasatospora sp. CB01950 TaxID=1703930 RepID=UPI0011610965|nr:hypothetical protein [Kitasatospora sp. CB01950]